MRSYRLAARSEARFDVESFEVFVEIRPNELLRPGRTTSNLTSRRVFRMLRTSGSPSGSRSADRYRQPGNLIDATRVLQLNVLVVW